MSKTKVVITNVQLIDLVKDTKFNVLGETVIGRTEGQLNFPADHLMSRKHLRVLPTEEFVLVEDLGSTNFTSLNKKKLKANKLYRIRSRDILEFGNQRVQVIIGGEVSDDKTKVAEPALVKGYVSNDNSISTGGSGESKFIKIDTSGLEFEDDLEIMESNAKGHEEFAPELMRITQNKNAKYFVQFEGSEFGPLVLKELETVISSQKFQGGAVLVWSEGLSNWVPVGALLRIMGLKNPEVVSTKKIESSFSLVATVFLYLDEQKTKKAMGTCQSISLSDILVSMQDSLADKKGSIVIDVVPLKSSGVEKFSTEVTILSKEMGGYLFSFVNLSAKVKGQLEKYSLKK